MKKFVWTDKYKLGINIIDTQHQHFFEIVNKIYDMLEKKDHSRMDVIEIVDELKDYALYHLATEEKYFNQFAYSDIANHMKYHADFREKTVEYTDRVKNEGEDFSKLALEIADFSVDWLTHHILVADQMYVSFFKAHNIN